MNGVILIELAQPDVPTEMGLRGRSWILAGLSTYYTFRGYFFMAEGIRRHESLGKFFAEIEPPPNKRFTLELGIVLPDLFPNLNDAPESEIGVLIKGSIQPICFSNTMARLRYKKDDQELQGILPRCLLNQIGKGAMSKIPESASVELLRTMAATRFSIEGDSAVEAMDSHCESRIDIFIEALNRCLKAIPLVGDEARFPYSVAYSQATLPAFYFVLEGNETGKFANGWISPHIGRTIYNPSNLSDESALLLRKYLDGSAQPDDLDSLLYAAQSFLDGGVIEYVLLLSVIAAESATQEFVESRLSASGVSNNKLKEIVRDLTYSQMLNAFLWAVTPAKMKPNRLLVGKMNRARDLRNDYMHKAKAPLNSNEIADILSETRKFIGYLRAVSETLTKDDLSRT
jgi:hypothetical protein